MKEIHGNLSGSLGKTLVESDLGNITTEIVESVLDETLLENSLLKEIPILSSLVSIGKTTASVKNYLFTKKLLAFLSGLSEVSHEKRKEAISRVNSDPKYKQSVGSKLLFIIESSQDHLTAKLISKLFVAFIKGELDYKEFCKSSLIINRLDYYDLETFLSLPDDAYGRHGTEGIGLEEVDNFLINAGLCSAEPGEIIVEDQEDWKMPNKYVVEGGRMIIYRTLIGTKIYRILSS